MSILLHKYIIYPNLIRPFLYLVIVTFLSSATKDGSTQSFTMSSLGSFDRTTALSHTIAFNSVTPCLNVQTGLAVLRGIRNDGVFTINCDVNLLFNDLTIKMFPIPTQNNAIVKIENLSAYPIDFSLSVWSIDGVQLLQRKEISANLAKGISLDVSALPAGSYVLRIESSKSLDAIKFIKGY